MNKKLIPLILASSFLVACNDKAPSAAAGTSITVNKEDAIASVNGTYISKNALTILETELSQRGRGSQSFPQEKLIEELVQRELLIQEAVQKKLDTSSEFIERMATIRNSLLSQAAIQDYMKSNPVTDAEIRAEYEKNISTSGTEFKARHILLKTEEESKAIIEELNKGADFAELAKTKSTGPSGPKGGDLGWFNQGQMVPPFSEAVVALEDNKYTSEAVKTQFGWHVILREGSRAQTPPPFESVKEQIRPMLQRQKMQAFLDSLKNQAKIVILLPDVEEKKQTMAEKVINTTKDVAAQATKELVDVATTAKDKAGEAVKDLSDGAKDTAGQAAKGLTDVVNSAKDAAGQAAKDLTEKASETADKVGSDVVKSLDAVIQ